MRSIILTALLPALTACSSATRPALEAHSVRATSNPILSDGTDYTADPAPLVADGKLYIITGRDTAGPRVNDFQMPEWQMLETGDDPKAGRWTHYPHFLKPDEVFRWAAPGRAYAAQIVKGPNGRFYLYAPVIHAAATTRDKFAIGVAVADTPLGPWRDAHPDGPVVSQSYPVPNDIQNIDPTVLVDDDGRVFLYWGTFGHLKGVELERDMVTFKGTPGRCENARRLFRSRLALQAQRHVLHGVRRQHRRSNVGLHRGDLLRVHRLRNRAFTIGSVDL